VSRAVFRPSDLPRPSRMARKIEVDPEFGCWLWTGSRNREVPSGYAGSAGHVVARGTRAVRLGPAM
jgi:hypothetical protein